MKRRNFLIGTAVAAGGLAIGYRVWTNSFEAQAAALVTGDGGSLLGGWVKIAPDDTVTVYVPHIDMGQGTHTALAMMLAEELDADWSRVRTERAPSDKAFANRFLAEGWILQGWRLPAFLDGAVDTAFGEAARFANLQITGGSTAVRFTGQVGLRIVGAAARSMLIEAAARRWQVSARELAAADSVVSHAASGRTARYGELAAEAAKLSVPASPRFKQRQDYKIIGRSVPRLDIPAKVTGAMQYGIDVQLPGMLYATVKAAPVHGGKLTSVDPAPAMKIKGVERVIRLDDAVAVVAQGYWPASRGLAALAPVFSDDGNGAVSSQRLRAQYNRALAGKDGKSVHKSGDVEAAFKGVPANRIVEATYHVPFLHHAAMEPINATAQFKDGKLTVWAGEQDALASKASLVEWSGLKAADVTLIALPAGGSFGRRARPGAPLRQALQLAMQMAPRPIKMIWSREEDFVQGTYRPALASRIRAALDSQGKPIAWTQLFIDSPGLNEGFPIPYGIANQSIASVASPHHVRTGKLAQRRPYAARLLHRVLHRRAGAGGRSRSVRIQARPAGARLAPSPRPRNGGGQGGLGRAAGAGRRSRHRPGRELRLGRRPCRRGLDRRGRHAARPSRHRGGRLRRGLPSRHRHRPGRGRHRHGIERDHRRGDHHRRRRRRPGELPRLSDHDPCAGAAAHRRAFRPQRRAVGRPRRARRAAGGAGAGQCSLRGKRQTPAKPAAGRAELASIGARSVLTG